ncbi:unnamed protein product [Ascophyllum nodosum]
MGREDGAMKKYRRSSHSGGESEAALTYQDGYGRYPPRPFLSPVGRVRPHQGFCPAGGYGAAVLRS